MYKKINIHVMLIINYPIVWRIASSIFKSSAIVPNVEITERIVGTLPALNKPFVSSACVVRYQLNHQFYAYINQTMLSAKFGNTHILSIFKINIASVAGYTEHYRPAH